MELHDILPPLEIVDPVYLYLVGLLFLGLLGLLVFVVRQIWKRLKKKSHYHLDILEKCDFKDAKKTARQFSYYGKYLFSDEVFKPQFLALKQRLNRYKYIQDLTEIPQELEDEIKQLLHQIRVHHD